MIFKKGDKVISGGQKYELGDHPNCSLQDAILAECGEQNHEWKYNKNTNKKCCFRCFKIEKISDSSLATIDKSILNDIITVLKDANTPSKKLADIITTLEKSLA